MTATPPPSTAEAAHPKTPTPGPAHKPWIVYLMGLWAFFGCGAFVFSFGRELETRDPENYLLFAALSLAALVVLTVTVLQMHRRALQLFGVFCVGMAAWQLLTAGLLLSQGSAYPVGRLVVFFVVPSVGLGAAALRPRFLATAVRYRQQRDTEAMRKIAFKQLRK